MAGAANSKGDRGFGGGKPGGHGSGGGAGESESESNSSESESTGPDTGRRGTTGEQENEQNGGLSGGGNETGKSETNKAETPSTPSQDRRAAAVAAMTEQETSPGDPNANTPSQTPTQQTEKQKGLFSKVGDFFSQQVSDFKADPLGYMGDFALSVAPGVATAVAGPIPGMLTAAGIAGLQGATAEEAAAEGVSQGLQSAASKFGHGIAGPYGGFALGALASQVDIGKPSAQTEQQSQSRTSDPSTGRRSKAADAFSDRGGNRGMTAGVGGMAQPGFSLSNFDPTAYASHVSGMQANNPNGGLLFTT